MGLTEINFCSIHFLQQTPNNVFFSFWKHFMYKENIQLFHIFPLLIYVFSVFRWKPQASQKTFSIKYVQRMTGILSSSTSITDKTSVTSRPCVKVQIVYRQNPNKTHRCPISTAVVATYEYFPTNPRNSRE